jgi:prepilin signal peptidase PulO-like enzyme (type II secretory pathway)
MLCWTLLVLAVLLLFVLPVLSGSLLRAGYMPRWLVDSLQTLESFQTWIMRSLVVAWLFFFGACFASFLNVVAWRIPRGRGINGSSYCPHCNVRLRMTDNMPIVGWLKNRGRCRDCRTPITIRYLIVEVALGAVTLGLIALEVFWSGVNLPGTGIGHTFEIIGNLIAQPRYDLIQIVCFHLVLVYALFTATVIRSERLAIPRAVVLVAAAFGIGLSTAMTHSFVLDWQGLPMNRMGVGRAWLFTIGMGTIAGLCAGYFFDQLPAFNGRYKTAAEVDLETEESSGSPPECPPDIADLDQVAVKVETDGGELAELEFAATASDCDANESFSKVDDAPTASEPISDKVKPIRYRPVSSLPDGVATLSLVGLFLGWQAVVSVVVLLVFLLPIRRLFNCKQCQSLASQVFWATLIHLVGWRMIAWALPF